MKIIFHGSFSVSIFQKLSMVKAMTHRMLAISFSVFMLSATVGMAQHTRIKGLSWADLSVSPTTASGLVNSWREDFVALIETEGDCAAQWYSGPPAVYQANCTFRGGTVYLTDAPYRRQSTLTLGCDIFQQCGGTLRKIAQQIESGLPEHYHQRPSARGVGIEYVGQQETVVISAGKHDVFDSIIIIRTYPNHHD